MNSSVTWCRDTSVMSSLCLAISPSSRSKGPSNTSRWTWKPPEPGAAGRSLTSSTVAALTGSCEAAPPVEHLLGQLSVGVGAHRGGVEHGDRLAHHRGVGEPH